MQSLTGQRGYSPNQSNKFLPFQPPGGATLRQKQNSLPSSPATAMPAVKPAAQSTIQLVPKQPVLPEVQSLSSPAAPSEFWQQQAGDLLKQYGPSLMKQFGPPIARKVGLPLARRFGPPLARKVGIPLARRVGLPLVRKVFLPLAKRAGFALVRRIGLPL